MPAAAALDVIGVHDASVDDREGVGHGKVLVEAVGVDGDLHVVFVGDASAVSRERMCAPRSSCTLNAQTPPSNASSSGPGREDEPRPRKPTLMGHASKAA